MASTTDVYVTFGGDTAALEAATAAVRAQMQSMAREMRSVALDFNKVGAAADSELGKKLKALGGEMAAAKSSLGELSAMSAKGGDAIKRMAETVGNAAYEYGPWTGAHVQLAQAVGEGLTRAFSKASVGAKVMTVGFGGAAVAAAALGAVVIASRETIAEIGQIGEAARLAGVSLKQMQDLERSAVVSGGSREGMATALAGIAKAANDATRAENDFSKILKANNIALTDGHGALRSTMALLVDYGGLVARAKTEQDKLVLLGAIGSGKDMVEYFSQGSEKIRDLTREAAAAGGEIDGHMVKRAQEFDTAWKAAWDHFDMGWKTAIMDVLGQFDKLRAAIPTPIISAETAGGTVGHEIASIMKVHRGELPAWAGDLGAGGSAGAGHDMAALRSSMAASTTKIPTDSSAGSKSGSSDTGEIQAQIKAFEDQIAAARQTEQAKDQLYASGVQLHIISEQQKLTASKAALDEEVAAERAALQQELQIEGLKPQQKQAINDKLKALDAKYASDSSKLFMQGVQDQLKGWDSMIDGMEGSLNSGIMGMVNGTMTLRKALANVAEQAEQSFLKMGLDMAANWAKAQLTNVVLAQTTEGQKTAAALAGASARAAIVAGEAGSSIATMIASALKSIAVDAGVAGAGATAFSAPFMGPAAIGEGAAVKAAVLGFVPSMDIGAWQIDQDQLALVHRNEMVMPAAEAGAFRSMLSGAASGGGSGGASHTHNYNGPVSIQTSAQGIAALIKADPKGTAKAIGDLVRYGHLKTT